MDIQYKKELPENFTTDLLARLEESDQSVTVFFNAVRKNNLPMVKKLLRKMPLMALEVNEKMQTVLHVAARKKNLIKMV